MPPTTDVVSVALFSSLSAASQLQWATAIASPVGTGRPGPVNAFSLWDPDAVQVTRGADNIGTYNKTPKSYRKWCKTCGGHIFTEHPEWGLTDVYAAVVPDFPYQPGVHVNYQETVLRIEDGLPKLKDVPEELGGSGASVPE